MNVVSQDTTKNPLTVFLNGLMGNSFGKEKTIYNKIGIKVDHPRDLNANKCKEIYDAVFNKNDFNSLLSILRNEQFYQKILNLFSSRLDSITKNKVKKIKNLSSNIKAKINEEIRDIENLNNTNNNQIFIKTKEITKIISKSLEEMIESNTNSPEKILYDIILEIEKKENEDNYELKISESTKTINWNQNTTIDFLTKLSQETGIKIFTEYYIIDPTTDTKNVVEIKNALLNSIFSAVEQMDIGKEQEKNLKNILKDNAFQNKIEQYLKIEEGQNLILGPKTFNKIKGNLGEFLSSVLIDHALKLQVSFGGDVKTSTGEAAVDIFIKKMGFQIKNFPRSENSSNPISLYAEQFFINPRNNSNRRAMTGEEQNQLYKSSSILAYKNSKTQDKNEAKTMIQELLIKIFPNFIRYSQNFYLDNSLTNDFKKITNNFYVINFRMVPASRIFYELIQQIENNSEDGNSIEKFFYLTKEQIVYTSTSTKINFFESFRDDNIVNLFKGKNKKPVNLVFRGIQIDYKGLKNGEANGNLLAQSFKRVSFKK